MSDAGKDELVWTKEERQAFYRMDDVKQMALPQFWRKIKIAQGLGLISLILEDRTQEVERRVAEQRDALAAQIRWRKV